MERQLDELIARASDRGEDLQESAGLATPCPNDNHPTQNDVHGSAKIARLMIAGSLAAWRVINEQGRAPVDAPTRQLAASLEQLDAGLAGRLARAMEFVRPGFDEPCPGTVRPGA